MSLVEMGFILVGDCTIGSSDVPGVAAVTLGSLCFRVDRVRHGRSVVDVGAFVSSAQ